MEYTVSVTIDLPRERVIELFDSSENLKKWQSGLELFEHINGEPGMAGAKSRMVYDMNGRRTEMLETILERNFPDAFSATYSAKGVMNWVYNRFFEEGSQKTRWEMYTIFKFKGVMAVMSLFMRSVFTKQTLSDMNKFKMFAQQA